MREKVAPFTNDDLPQPGVAGPGELLLTNGLNVVAELGENRDQRLGQVLVQL